MSGQSAELVKSIIVYGSWLVAIGVTITGIVLRIQTKRWWTQPYVLGSLAGALILICSGQVLAIGEIARELYDKSQIVILILAFSYLSISLDRSGFFEYAAATIVRQCKGNGYRLFFRMFLLVSVLTFFTSNDIVILTMTPIVIYACRRSQIKNMVPLLISQFFAANILSMGLYVGSPTNIVIAQSLDITFIDYTRWMLFPAAVSGAACLGVTFLTFTFLSKHKMPRTYSPAVEQLPISLDGEMVLKLVIFGGCLTVMAMTSFPSFPLSILHVCVIFSLLCYLIDLQLVRRRRLEKNEFNCSVLSRLPWGIVPFALSFFLLVKGFSEIHATERLGDVLRSCVALGEPGAEPAGVVPISILYATVSGVMVNLMNDIPTTVFFSDVLMHLRELITEHQPGHHDAFRAATFGTLVGVNPGCGMSMIGALAGLMWFGILRQHKTHDTVVPGIRDLSFYGIPMMFVVILAGALAAAWQIQFPGF